MNFNNKYSQVIYDFEANYGDEITVKASDIVQVLYKIDDDWMYVRTLMEPNRNSLNHAGIVPSSYLSHIDIPDNLSDNDTIYLATGNFYPTLYDDLELEKGDLVVCQRQIDSKWLVGYCLNKPFKTGNFPLTHVKKLDISRTKNPNQNKDSDRPSYTSLKQAKVIKAFYPDERRILDSIDNYLKLEIGDYVLVTDKVDDNWLSGENYNGKKGIFPAKYVEFIESNKNETDINAEELPILNRTQRRYTLVETVEDNKIEPIQSISSSKSFSNLEEYQYSNQQPIISTLTENKEYCLVNYDFKPEMNDELGCMNGEYLKIIDRISDGSEWVKCKNYYGKIGLVPLNYVTLLDTSYQHIFENQKKKLNSIKTDSLDSLITNEMNSLKKNFESNNSSQTQTSNKVANIITNYDRNFIIKVKTDQTTVPKWNNVSDSKPELNYRNSNSADTMNKGPSEEIKQINQVLLSSIIRKSPSKTFAQPGSSNNNICPPVQYSNPFYNEITEISANSTKFQPVQSSAAQSVTNIADTVSLDEFFGKKPQNNQDSNNKELAMSEFEIKNPENDKAFKKKRERQLTIEELIQTERDFCNEMSICYDIFMVNDIKSPEPEEFNKRLLFDKLRPIIDFSRKLIDWIDAEIQKNDKNLDNILISEWLSKWADEMKIIYAHYARNHNDIADALKKYESNQVISDYIKSRLDLIKDKVRVAALPTLLIKPVQRIFKYPLFISRLVENTDFSHPDYENLKNTSKIFTEMLEFINEYKRRKDLVNKYLSKMYNNSEPDLSFTDLMKKINMKTLKKKSTRISLQISNILGIFNHQVSDDKFQVLENEYRIVEKSLRNYFYNVEGYLNNFKDLLDCEKNIFSDLLLLMGDELSTFSKFEMAANSKRSIEFQNYSNKIIKTVTTPLYHLIGHFAGPSKLISKRYDKLLDYEAALSDFEFKSPTASIKELEQKVEKAKKDYEALNYQLIEELPQLIKMSFKVLMISSTSFANITQEFVQSINKNYKKNIEDNLFDRSNNFESFGSSIMLRLNNLHNMFINRQSVVLSGYAEPAVTPAINNSNTTQTEEQKQKLLKKYPIDKLYIVTQNYVANEKLCQLSQSVNDMVGLKIPYDPARQPHIWFVDNGNTEGFIPCSALTPYSKITQNTNLINLDDQTNSNSRQSRLSSNRDDLPAYSDVQLINLSDTPPNALFCIAAYRFEASKPNMIDLVAGEIYKIIEKSDKKGNSDWWLVEWNNQRGYAPSSYLQVLD